MADNLSAYHSEFPIYDDVYGKQLGVQYKGEDGFTAKVGADNYYSKNRGSAFLPEKTRYQLALAQQMGDFKAYGDIAGKSGWDPTGRVGVKYKPSSNSAFDAQIYNYDKSRDDFMDRGTLQLKAKYNLTDDVALKLMGRLKQDGVGDTRATVQYKSKF